MRRIAVLFFLFLLTWWGLSGVVAQGTPPPPTPEPVVTAVPPSVQPLPTSIFLTPVDPATITTALVPVGGNEAADQCGAATTIVFLNTAVGGVTPNIENKTSSSEDPTLSCMWGSPSRPNGYRTVWYKFTAVTNAIVTINADTSNYDTVIGVFTPANMANACTTLQPVACNDDFTGFTSKVTFAVVQNQTYYVVIADWSSASSGQQTLNIFMQPQPVDAKWQLVDNHPGGQVTHHDTAVVGEYIYVVGGQTNVLGSPNRSNKLYRYHVPLNAWQEMAQMPGAGITDLTAVYANGRIFVPGGDDGTPGAFNPTHYVYHINGNFWSLVSSPPAAVGWAQTVAAVDESGYYLIGGTTSKPVDYAATAGQAGVYFYDITANSWAPRPSMNSARFGHVAARVGNRICVVGGLSGGTLINTGECWTPPFGQSWQAIPSLNIPRFGAGSAVGPDGKWYVFGGTTYSNQAYVPVASTEVYDPAHPGQGWVLLGVAHDLVDPDTVFARQFPAGEFVGNHLYAIGGNHFVQSLSEYAVVPLVQRLYAPTYKLYIPRISTSGTVDFDDNMAAARALPPNLWYAADFGQSTDFYDFYYFDLGAVSGVSVRLNTIPSGSNYDLYVFNDNKLLWGSSTNPGNVAEEVNLTLAPGRYYVLAQRLYGPPEGAFYQVAVIR